jgi:hypothetical protein
LEYNVTSATVSLSERSPQQISRIHKLARQNSVRVKKRGTELHGSDKALVFMKLVLCEGDTITISAAPGPLP